MATAGQKRKRPSSEPLLPTPQAKHPYLSGNFAPINQTLSLTPCNYVGTIPGELADGEYVRNGSNPISNEDLGRDAHWFDGDGMLAGVSFRKDGKTGQIEPEFVNQYILTDIYLSAISSTRLRRPILPSIATLVNPLVSFVWVSLQILRTILLVLLSHLPGSKQKIKRISAANTHIVYHDGRALALCESGPPLRIQLPGLETVGWFNGAFAEGESTKSIPNAKEDVLGGNGGLISFMREWTTAHPKTDPETKEMLMFHASFAPPYVQYSILPQSPSTKKLVSAAVSGVSGARMMHDFGVSSTHTIIMDLPLSLDPFEQVRGKPPVNFDVSKPSRFGVFPRWRPDAVTWFETDACCIFHTANAWDDKDALGQTRGVSMLACRLTSATMVFAAGNIAPPADRKKTTATSLTHKRMPFLSKYDADMDVSVWDRSAGLECPAEEKEALMRITCEEHSPPAVFDDFDEEQCRLYYYHFDLQSGAITHQWALSAVPCEFPSVHPGLEMSEAKYVYGCSTTSVSFGAALGKATKIDALIKVDTTALIARGRAQPPRSVTGVVDDRSMAQVLASNDPDDPVRAFKMPEGWFAQEPRFVPAASKQSEDDGYLLFYAFDEAQLDAAGDVPPDGSQGRAKSELWIVDAKTMRTVIARVKLPQRVPYGLHGTWFSAAQINEQRPVATVRSTTPALAPKDFNAWMSVRDWIETKLG